MTDTITMPHEVAKRILRNIEIGNALSAGIEMRREIEAALEQPQGNLPEFPEGWKLVPVEPADSQIRAAQDTWWHACNCETYWDQVYAAMIAAAPQPPAVKDYLTAEQPQSVADCHQSQPQGDQEPVAYRHMHEDGWEYYDAPTGSDCDECQPLYTHPQPKRKPLTNEEINNMDVWLRDTPFWRVLKLARAIEAAHGIGGEA